MVFYKEEEDMLKCWKHPSKHRSGGGICPLCLRDRLLRLCPDCANVRPCSCYPTSTTTTTSSSSSSSSYSDVPTSFSSFGSGGRGSIGVIGRMSNLIDNEPAFQRSRSSTTAFPFLRSKISDTKDSNFSRLPPMGSSSSSSNKSSFWSSMFKVPKLKKVEEEEFEEKKNLNFKMMRSKSAGIPSSKNDVKSKGKKGGWNFPSPIKAFPFRQSNNNKTSSSSSSKVVQERSPLCRG